MVEMRLSRANKFFDHQEIVLVDSMQQTTMPDEIESPGKKSVLRKFKSDVETKSIDQAQGIDPSIIQISKLNLNMQDLNKVNHRNVSKMSSINIDLELSKKSSFLQELENK